MSRELIKEVQSKLNLNTYLSTNVQAYGKGVLLHLVLLNYRPICRYKNGKKEYLYLNSYDSEGMAYFLDKRRSNLGSPVVLSDILEIAAKRYQFLEEVCSILKTPLEIGIQSQKGKIIKLEEGALGNDKVDVDCGNFDSKIKYSRENVELQALLFFTEEFTIFEQAAYGNLNPNRLMNYLLSDTMLLRANGRNKYVTTAEWIYDAFSTYMFYRNIDLSEYYYTNQKKPSSEIFFQINRMCVLDEFVPILYNFDQIYNPVYSYMWEDGNRDISDPVTSDQNTGSQELLEVFKGAIVVSPLSRVDGKTFSTSMNTNRNSAIYTTRDEIGKLFKLGVPRISRQELVSAGKLLILKKKHTVDFYSPKYFMTLMHTKLMNGIKDKIYEYSGVDLVLLEQNDEVLYTYTDEYWDKEAEEGSVTRSFTSASLSYLGPETSTTKKRKEMSANLKESQAKARIELAKDQFNEELRKLVDEPVEEEYHTSWLNGLYLEYIMSIYGGVVKEKMTTKIGKGL